MALLPRFSLQPALWPAVAACSNQLIFWSSMDRVANSTHQRAALLHSWILGDPSKQVVNHNQSTIITNHHDQPTVTMIPSNISVGPLTRVSPRRLDAAWTPRGGTTWVAPPASWGMLPCHQSPPRPESSGGPCSFRFSYGHQTSKTGYVTNVRSQVT